MKKHCLGCEKQYQIHLRDKKGELADTNEHRHLVLFHNKDCMKKYFKLVAWGGIPETW